jgi:hypothetical protein
MPSPVTTPPLVFSRNTRPAPPVAMTTDLASTSVNSPGTDLDRDDALDATVLDHQINAEMFVEALDRRVLDRGLEERVQHVETGLVGGEPGALDLHAAEGAHVDVAVRRAAPRAAPVLELGQFLGAVRHEVLDHILLAQASRHRQRYR